MLCLTRKVRERIILKLADGREIVISVAAIDVGGLEFPRGKARIGIEAPADVFIFREELRGEIEATGSVRINKDGKS